MARVVQRRTTPPYLAIVFAVLFLMATTVAVLFYVKFDNTGKEYAAYRAERTQISLPLDESQPDIRAMMQTSKGEGTVVSQLRKRVDQLAGMIAPAPTTYDDAFKKANELKAKSGLSLVAAVEQQQAAADQAVARQAELATQREQLERDKTQLAQARDALLKKHADDLAALEAKVKEAEAKSGAAQKDYQDKIDKTTAEMKAKIEEYEKNINTKTAEGTKLGSDLRKANARIAELQAELIALKGGGIDFKGIELRPDGRIIKLLEGQDIAYVNLGSKDNVQVGLTLAVYPASGIPQEARSSKKEEAESAKAKPKARLRIVNVYADTAECMITEQSDVQPLAVGDVVVNLAHDVSRTFTFVVEGNFDLRGTGTPTAAGAEDAKELIRRAGGKVSDEVNFQTDFVVLGDPPPAPSKPAEGSAPSAEKLYRDQLKSIERYNQVKEQAKNVPLLSGNRFLWLMGYVAPKQVK